MRRLEAGESKVFPEVHFEFDVEPFKVNVAVFIRTDIEELRASKHYVEMFGAAPKSFQACCSYNDERHLVIWLRYGDFESAVHESCHATMRVFEWCGIPHIAVTDEVWAYTYTNLLQEVMACMGMCATPL